MERVAVVCNANLCRSPAAAALLRARLRTRGVTATVASAGLLPGDATPGDGLVEAMRERGIDLSGHRSRRLDADTVRAADLVVIMEHHHLGDVLLLDRGAWERTFTLKDLVRRAKEAGPRRPGEPLDRWLGRVGRGRTRLDAVGAWGDDIVDPAGGSPAQVLETVDEIGALVGRLVDLAWPREVGRAP